MKRFANLLILFFMLANGSALLAQVTRPTDPRTIKDSRPSGGATSSGMTKTNSNGVGSFNAAVNSAGTVREKAEYVPLNAELIKKYGSSITAEDLQALLSFIASDELEGRETGTRGQKVAARYLASQFQKIGLKPGNKGEWYQQYKLLRTEVANATVSLTSKDKLEVGKDLISMSKMSFSHNLDADYVFAGYGIETDDYNNLDGLDAKGKVAIALVGEPMPNGKSIITGTEQTSEWTDDMDLKVRALQKLKAEAVLFVMPDADFKRLSENPWIQRSLKSKALMLAYKMDKQDNLPTFFVSESTLNGIFKKAKTTVDAQKKLLAAKAAVPKLDLSKSRFKLDAKLNSEEVTAENVLGIIEGTDKKDEVVIITAHYDHLGIQNGEIYNGADDDGTGTVSILEIAEAFMQAVKDGNRPRRTILFMAVSGEEKGLLGSEYYSDHPVFPLNKSVCDLNIDMTGRVDEAHKGEPQYIYVIGSDKLSSQLHEANENANKVMANLDFDYTYNSPDDPNRFYYRSDHYNFAKHGIPIIFYFSGVHEDYHKPTDDIEKILFPRVARVAQLVFTTAWDVANREEKLVVDKKSDFPEER